MCTIYRYMYILPCMCPSLHAYNEYLFQCTILYLGQCKCDVFPQMASSIRTIGESVTTSWQRSHPLEIVSIYK